jgi:hypothetical protein
MIPFFDLEASSTHLLRSAEAGIARARASRVVRKRMLLIEVYESERT